MKKSKSLRYLCRFFDCLVLLLIGYALVVPKLLPAIDISGLGSLAFF